MTQLELTLSRRTDPHTSHAAAARVSEFKARHEAMIWDALKTFGPMTADETAGRTRLSVVEVARRRKGMEEKLLIRRTGQTRPGITGRQQEVWEAGKA